MGGGNKDINTEGTNILDFANSFDFILGNTKNKRNIF